MFSYQPTDTQTLYAELVARISSMAAERTVLTGSFVQKELGGQQYAYFQHSLPGGTCRQYYLGKLNATLAARITEVQAAAATANADRKEVGRLGRMLLQAGAVKTHHAQARVLLAFAEFGVFAAGGVLVGSHAFAVLCNAIGILPNEPLWHTQDIDIAGPSALNIALPDTKANVPAALESLEMGFAPIPQFDPLLPSVSFKVRGRALRVDLLTSSRKGRTEPVFVERFGAAAQPLHSMGLLLGNPMPAALVSTTPVLVNVPTPEAFALHKLLVSQMREAHTASKRQKDLSQAVVLLSYLVENDPERLVALWNEWTSANEPQAARLRRALKRVTTGTKGLTEGLRGVGILQ